MRYVCHDDPITPLAPIQPGAVLHNVTKWALLGASWPILTVALDQREFERRQEEQRILVGRDGGKTMYTSPGKVRAPGRH